MEDFLGEEVGEEVDFLGEVGEVVGMVCHSVVGVGRRLGGEVFGFGVGDVVGDVFGDDDGDVLCLFWGGDFFGEVEVVSGGDRILYFILATTFL